MCEDGIFSRERTHASPSVGRAHRERADGLRFGVAAAAPSSGGSLALIDPDSIRKEPDLPDLDLPARIVLEGAQIDRAVKAADMVSDHIALGVDADEETFYADAVDDTDDVHFELARADLIDLEVEDAQSLYSLDYLEDMNRAFPKNGEVTVHLGEEFPVEIEFKIAEGPGHVRYLLAPRIQSD